MTQEQAFQFILDLLKRTPDLKSKVPLEKLNLQTLFRKEMGFDSIALAAFFYELQETYPNLSEKSVPKWLTLGDCARTISEL